MKYFEPMDSLLPQNKGSVLMWDVLDLPLRWPVPRDMT